MAPKPDRYQPARDLASQGRALTSEEADVVIGHMKHALTAAPWSVGVPRWHILNQSLREGHPEALSFVQEKLDPRHIQKWAAARRARERQERNEARYQEQALELGDHTHLPAHKMDALARGKDVWLYHGTSSKLVPKILKEGLHAGMPSVSTHLTKEPGVYLTARAEGGPATAEFYARGAAAHFGGEPKVLRVKVPYDSLSPDEDDADIASGRHQFVSDHVPPEHIYEVGDKRLKRSEEVLEKVQPLDHSVYEVDSYNTDLRDRNAYPSVWVTHKPTGRMVGHVEFSPRLKFVDHGEEICPKCADMVDPEGNPFQGSYHSEAESFEPRMVQVHPDHRRRGLASAMYAHMEEKTGLPILQGGFQSPEGAAFRAGLGKSEEDLEKAQTPPTFPKLGIHSVRSPTPVVETKAQQQTKLRGMYAPQMAQTPNADRKEAIGEGLKNRLRQPPAGVRSYVGTGVNSGYASTPDVVNAQYPDLEPAYTDSAMRGTQQHEDWHDVMGQVEAKYGREARRHLATNLVNHGHNHDQIGDFGLFAQQVKRMYPDAVHANEEVVAKLHNYLNDSRERGLVQRMFPGRERAADANLKLVWRHIQDAARHADKRWLTLASLDPPPVVKSEDLEKVKVTPEDTAQRMRPHTASPWEALERVETYKAGEIPHPWGDHPLSPGNNVYHHVYHQWTSPSGYKSVLHALSSSPDPADDSKILSSASVSVEPAEKIMADDWAGSANLRTSIPWRTGDVMHVGETATHPGVQGRGYGTRLYEQMLRYHGRIASDGSVSAGASKVWERLKNHPEFRVQTHYDSPKTHWAEYNGPKMTPIAVRDASKHPAGKEEPSMPGVFRAQLLKSDDLQDVGEQGMINDMKKSIDPKHLKTIGTASVPEGAATVDHAPDLVPHPAVTEGASLYRAAVLNSPKPVGRRPSPGTGITRKAVFEARKPDGTSQKFLVKPYHEKVDKRLKGWMKFPIQGWAEMTNQALYHAGGIGHLHQKVHVDEHQVPTGAKVPALVVHLADGYDSVANGGKNHTTGGPELRQIAMMDFLAANQDRHGENLMIGRKAGENLGKPLAIDQSRNFQYAGLKMDARKGVDDTFRNYADGQVDPRLGGWNGKFSRIPNAIGMTEPFLNWEIKDDHQRQMDTMERYAPTFEWWGEVGPKVREVFHQRLGQIKDPEVREHLKRNFDARADWLDERAKFGLENYGTDWYNHPVESYKPGELTDDQRKDPLYLEDLQRRAAAFKAGKEAELAKDPVVAYKKWLNEKPVSPRDNPRLSREAQDELEAVHPGDRPSHPAWRQYYQDHKAWFDRRPPDPSEMKVRR